MKEKQNAGFATVAKNISGIKPKFRVIFGLLAMVCLFGILFFVAGFFSNSTIPETNYAAISQDEFFDVDNISDIHLQFNDSAWMEMEPYGGPYGDGRGGQGTFSRGYLMGLAFLRYGDINKDEILTEQEFIGLGKKWFSEWDTKGEKLLDLDMLDVGYGSNTGSMGLQGPERNGIARAVGINTPTVKADFTFNELEYPLVSVRFKGNGTLFGARTILKRSIKVDVNDGFQSRNLAGISKINFHNLIEDPGYMNDALAYRLFRDAGVPGPRTSYAKVYLSNSDSLEHTYAGLYLIVENVDNVFAQDWYGTKKGAVFKPVTPWLFEYNGEDWNKYIKSYDPKTTLSIQETTRMIEIFKFVTFASDEEFSFGLRDFFDLDNLARYLAINVLICDLDGILGPGQNMFMYLHPKTQQLSFIPWDHDHSFGRMRGTQEERENLSVEKPWMRENRFLERLFQEKQFKDLYLHYLKEFNETLFKPERILAQINELAPIIRPAIAEESEEKLKNFDISVGWNIKPGDVTDSVDFADPKPIRAYISPRHHSVADQLAGKSKGKEVTTMYIPYKIMGNMLMGVMDADTNKLVSEEEFMRTFNRWFTTWSDSTTNQITFEDLRNGLDHKL